jgi:hypothetical protein
MKLKLILLISLISLPLMGGWDDVFEYGLITEFTPEDIEEMSCNSGSFDNNHSIANLESSVMHLKEDIRALAMMNNYLVESINEINKQLKELQSK